MKLLVAGDLKGLLSYCIVLTLAIPSSNGQCANGMCEKKSLSLKADTRRNVFLHGHVFETLNFSIWEECLNVCLRKCQCLSFNFNEVNKTENCELNDASTKLAPDALKAKEGVTYYEPVRSYFDNNVSTFVAGLLYSFETANFMVQLNGTLTDTNL